MAYELWEEIRIERELREVELDQTPMSWTLGSDELRDIRRYVSWLMVRDYEIWRRGKAIPSSLRANPHVTKR